MDDGAVNYEALLMASDPTPHTRESSNTSLVLEHHSKRDVASKTSTHRYLIVFLHLPKLCDEPIPLSPGLCEYEVAT